MGSSIVQCIFSDCSHRHRQLLQSTGPTMSAEKIEMAPKITPIDWALVDSCAQHVEALYTGAPAAQNDAAAHLLDTVFDPFAAWIAPESATPEQLLSLFRLSQALAELKGVDAKDADAEVLVRDDAIKKMKREESF